MVGPLRCRGWEPGVGNFPGERARRREPCFGTNDLDFESIAAIAPVRAKRDGDAVADQRPQRHTTNRGNRGERGAPEESIAGRMVVTSSSGEPGSVCNSRFGTGATALEDAPDGRPRERRVDGATPLNSPLDLALADRAESRSWASIQRAYAALPRGHRDGRERTGARMHPHGPAFALARSDVPCID